ncbi:hypothetical protein L2E82_17402 [Cichorium intybus]|uniref:Uncharacterized protein n=1 Tax=Cichorium intybus TaxID=13427 RepID=A0ACB9F9F4_CICIN|nr:hypothetical protein L2E82_17402 [Cichorium intybus]
MLASTRCVEFILCASSFCWDVVFGFNNDEKANSKILIVRVVQFFVHAQFQLLSVWRILLYSGSVFIVLAAGCPRLLVDFGLGLRLGSRAHTHFRIDPMCSTVLSLVPSLNEFAIGGFHAYLTRVGAAFCIIFVHFPVLDCRSLSTLPV